MVRVARVRSMRIRSYTEVEKWGPTPVTQRLLYTNPRHTEVAVYEPPGHSHAPDSASCVKFSRGLGNQQGASQNKFEWSDVSRA